MSYTQSMAVCSGAAPLLIAQHERVIGLRDTESVEDLAKRLETARRVMIVGNGGIAMEIANVVGGGVECVWSLRDAYLGHTFLDASASALIMPQLHERVAAATNVGTNVDTAAAAGAAGATPSAEADAPVGAASA